VAVAWFATLLLSIGIGFYYVGGGEQPPADLVAVTLMLTISGSWIMLKVAEGGRK